MARIVYGVMGDARGHLARSLAVAQELDEHEFLFAGGGVVAELRDQGREVVDLPMLGTVLKNGRVHGPATLKNTVAQLARRKRTIAALAERMREFKPGLAITDYEYFTPHAARLAGVPCVSLDNQHLLTHCRVPRPPGQRINRLATCWSIRHLFSAADRFLVSSFYQPPAGEGDSAEWFPPILPHDLEGLAPAPGEYAVVYMRGASPEDMKQLLRGRKREYRIYGLGEHPAEDNLKFFQASRQGFIRDLAGCRYVVSNGGHSLLSEALFLGKPVFALPTAMFYEQYANAYFLAVQKLGGYAMRPGSRARALDAFEAGLDVFSAEIRQRDFRGNERITARLREILERGLA